MSTPWLESFWRALIRQPFLGCFATRNLNELGTQNYEPPTFDIFEVFEVDNSCMPLSGFVLFLVRDTL
jgi:hypothetical protein